METDLNMTTAERLCAVADLIEAEPDLWHQQSWMHHPSEPPGDSHDPREIAGRADRAIACGTQCCVAGWAVSLSPRSALLDGDSWETAGARVLGLTDDAAERLFSGCNWNWPMPDVLRRLAKCAEPRTWEDLDSAVSDATDGEVQIGE